MKLLHLFFILFLSFSVVFPMKKKGKSLNDLERKSCEVSLFDAAKNNPKVLESLLNRVQDPNCEDKKNKTPLYYAVKARNIESVKILLQDPRVTIDEKKRPYELEFALFSFNPNPDIVRLFLQKKGIYKCL